MHCTKCGYEIPEGSKFCENCGAPVTAEPAAAPQKKNTINFKDKKVMIALIASVVFIAAIIGVVFVTSEDAAAYSQKLKLAEQYVAENDYDAAIIQYQEAIQLNPKKDDAYVGLANTYVAKGDPEKAKETLEEGREKTGHSDKFDELISKLENENGGQQKNGADNPPWAAAYQEILADPEGVDDESTSYAREYLADNYVFTGYYLYDLDKNGTPELYVCLKDEGMTLVVNHDGTNTVVSGIFCLTHVNADQKEMLEHGHWHGAGGSGENEWLMFSFDQKCKLINTCYIDHGPPGPEDVIINRDPEGDGDYDTASIDEYNKLYNEHVKPAKAISEIQKYDLEDMTAFEAFGVKAAKTAKVNEEEVYAETLKYIADVVNGKNDDDSKLPLDLRELLHASSPGIDVYYDLKDLDNNSVRELIISDDDGIPVGIYTVKDGKAFMLSELTYFYGILSDGTINSFQGNGYEEDYPDGHFFKLNGTELKEVSNPGLDYMIFDWTLIK